MTITISRLYNNYDDARAAVRDLEAAGVGHNDIAFSRAMWTIGIRTIARTVPIPIAIWTEKTTAPRRQGRAQGL
jgi:hypothetical protein